MVKIESLLNETRVNKEGVVYNLFDSNNRRKDIQILGDSLGLFIKAIKSIYPNIDKEKLDKHIENTFNRISGIRIDETDKTLAPMSILYNDFTEGGKIDFNQKKNDGVTRAVKDDGILMLIPDLKTRISEHNKESIIKGIHTFIHEFVHAMSVFEKNNMYFSGLQVNREDKILDELNEGMAEYFTHIIMQKMFPGFKIEERYGVRTKVIDAIMQNASKKQQDKIFEFFITGESEKVIQHFSKYENIRGENLISCLKEEYKSLIENKNYVNAEKFNDIINQISDFQFVRVEKNINTDKIL